MRKTAIAVAVAALAIAAGALSIPASGQVQSAPGPGSGVVSVTGRVEVADGMIRASQLGDWRILVANAPDVRVVNTATVARAPLPFLKQGARVLVTWQDGSTETVRLGQLAGGGWAQTETAGRTRWLNLDGARYVEEAK
jgi:hypothetical protein